MKTYSIEDIVKMVHKLLQHGHGELLVQVVDHKIPRCKYTESLKPEGEE